jgi:hypothetical protein
LVLVVERAVDVFEAVEPDNVVAPGFVRVSCRPAGSRVLECLVEVSGCPEAPERLLTMRNSVDDLLSHVIVAVGALRAARG